MAKMSDLIEVFIKELLEDSASEPVEIQRNELAGYFKCAPSQINYVLTTRFSMDKGYRIESQRGGGGSIKIIKMNLSSDDFYTALLQETGDSITVLKAGQMIDLLLEKELISEREDRLMKAAVSDRAIAGPVNLRNEMRAGILKNMILSVCGME
ncbi:MAG: CtsR family transcriptional regulator [Firmicutes bacterium]|nr:CtsR family transcriptional regulator [Bacillota bacterium]